MNKKNKSTRRRVNPVIRREEILNAAIDLAIKKGYQSITRDVIALRAKTSRALVTRYFRTMDLLKVEIVRTAIDREILPILAQVISLGDQHTSLISNSLKKRVLVFLNS